MGFKFHTLDDGRSPAIEYLPAGVITPQAGMALVQVNGLLAVASGATKPTYIAMTERENACESGEVIPVVRIQPDMVLGVPASVGMGDVALGEKVTISADGLSVTATVDGGVCEVIAKGGTDAGSEVLVRIA
ncbi:MAG: hypothetical protein IJ034_05790 [Mailhella sp.]|nr:hypothetical protein [Mailhella sp.]